MSDSFIKTMRGNDSDLCREYATGFAVVISPEGTISSISEKACELLGYKEEEIIGMNWLDTCLPENIRSEIRVILNNIIDVKVEFPVTGEVPVLTKDGEVINIGMRYSLVLGASGDITSILFYGKEVTDKENIETELREANEQLVKSLIARTRAENMLMEAKADVDFYLDLMSHDLTNFNQTLLGNLMLLERFEENSDKGREFIKTCIRQVKKSDSLISNVRALSLVSQVEKDMLQSLSLKSRILEAVNTVKTLFPEKDINVDFDETEDCFALATELLEHVILNVIENAVKNTPGDLVKIRITIDSHAGDAEKFWEVRISDEGTGVPENMKVAIFERYSRIREEKKGTGLGLSLSKAIIEKFGGSIWAEDRVEGETEKGSIFAFTVPKGK